MPHRSAPLLTLPVLTLPLLTLPVLTLMATMLLVGCRSTAPGPATRPAAELQRFEYRAIKMGSDYNLVLYAPDQATADAAAQAAEMEIDRLDAMMSDYKADSELSKLSRLTRDGPMKEPVAISSELYEVLALSQSLAAATGGAFDVTIGPYVQLWRRSRRQQQLPAPERLADARTSVGWGLLHLKPAPRTAQLLAGDMRLDLGGIASGYISDRVLAVLRDRGIRSAICDLSGDLSIGDPPPGRAGWRIAIQSLTAPEEIAEYLELSNCGVSTSGDTYRYIEIDNVRYSHIVDPKTGLGLTHRIGVTVVARDGVTADALATAISILGVEKGLALADNAEIAPETAVRIVAERDGKFETIKSRRYAHLN